MEQLLSLYKSSASNLNPAIFVDLVNRSLTLPGVYTLGEFYDVLQPHVSKSELSKDPSVKKYLQILEIYVYGTWNDYTANSSELPPLNDQQIKKLKQLTLASLGASANVLKYDTIASNLSLDKSDIEKFLIDSIYDEVCIGLIDSKNQRFEIKSVIARDISPQRLEEIESILDQRIRHITNVINESKSISFLSKEKAGQRSKEVRNYHTKLVQSLSSVTTSVKHK